MAERVRGARLATTVAAVTLSGAACGPVKGDGEGSASADGSTSADTTSASGMSASETAASSASSTASGSSSTGAPEECPDNVALEPFCYRRFPIDWDGDLATSWEGPTTARVGNFGPEGEEAFLLSAWDAGTPMALAFWNGAGFDVQPWGVVPDLSFPGGRIPIQFFDGVHSDLVVGKGMIDEIVVAVAPWTPDGPGEAIIVDPPTSGRILSIFNQQPVLDVDGDGIEEFAVYVDDDELYNGDEHFLVGKRDGVPAFFGPLITHDGACGGNVVGLAPGHFDDDAFVDLATIGYCDVEDYSGAFAFAAEWGDGTGVFSPAAVPFTGSMATSWLGAADFDGDGRHDVVIATDDAGPDYHAYIEVHRARGDRTFAPPVKIWDDTFPPGGYFAPGTAPDNRVFVLGDLDGDGRSELIFRVFMVAITDVLGEPAYAPMFDIPWSKSIEVVSAFDLNHDGRLDFIVRDDNAGIYALISS